ncbi:WW domain-containing oxidoreductase isoform X2 [Lycorma delicatula]|uniref:WW domain-containing oxidoreductase isoform X2 n=1 Tax=Lycorma delicatula TaxID=130591 RepID=UPI003F512FEB
MYRTSFHTQILDFYHSNKETQWTHPRTAKKKRVNGELPFGWVKEVNEDGKIIYIDKENGRTTYTDPRLAFAVEEKEFPMDIRQRFDSSTTARQILQGRDLSGKTAVVTGANCGIGFETARALALHGCTVVFACRSYEKGEEAIKKIKTERQQVKCITTEIDLGSFKSVQNFATSFKKRFKTLDILILNAGVFGLPYTNTVDGLETVIQVNHLSHVYLTLLLEEPLSKAAPSRVVVVSSESHRYTNLSADTVSENVLSPTSSSYWSMMAYNNSKLCNILFANKLAQKWQSKGICVYSLHPGNLISSYLSRYWWPYRLFFALVRPFTKSLEQAASSTVYCATALELENVTALYVNNCFPCNASNLARDETLAAKVWDISLAIIKKYFPDHGLPC